MLIWFVYVEAEETEVALAENNKVTLQWVPEHQGNPGNERMDLLAKDG